jgi:tRNA(Ile2)-agmatinylcytidine synthase
MHFNISAMTSYNNRKKRIYIGIDDTDSTRRGCTTYIAALLVEKLEKLGVNFLDYPNLIRLNPNVPWKTRGNGALCLRVEYDPDLEDHIKEETTSLVECYADFENKGTDPGVVFFTRSEIPDEIKTFAKKTITDVVTLKEALKLIRRFKGEALGFNTRRGIIGALAAIGENLTDDYTFELIAYRTPENYGKDRKVDESSIYEMDEATKPFTFNNVDRKKGRVVITPRGPDPILFGIRGESAEIVKKAFGLVRSLEPVERWMIFRTNQGTDAHLKKVGTLNQLKPYSSVIAEGFVSRNPWAVPLRHVIFSIKDKCGEVDCAAYEPSGELRNVARQLIVGDHVEVYGAIRKPGKENRPTINLEKIRILDIAKKLTYQNPACPECHKRLKSMGTNKGFRCEKCGTKYRQIEKIPIPVERELRKDMYFASTGSQRHLTKPLRRYGLERKSTRIESLIDGWHSI